MRECLVCGRQATRVRGNYGCEHCRVERLYFPTDGMTPITVSMTERNGVRSIRTPQGQRRAGMTSEQKNV